MDKNNKKTNKSNVKKIILIIALLLIVIAGAVFGVYKYQQAQLAKQKEENAKTYTELQEQVVKPAVTAEAEPESIEAETTPEEAGDDITVDFAALQEVNPDIYAWIYIPGMNVSYPVVQSDGEDQSYYLNHTVEHASGLPGSIYTENFNSKDFTDFNTIIYGHKMKDGSMFGSLQSYRDTSFWEEHPEIYIYTPEKKLTFRIFAAVLFDDRYIPDAYDFSTIAGKGQYLTDIQSVQDMNSHVFEDAYLDPNSKLLTLSTCVAGQETSRYLVEAYLTNEE
ncbi:MAG: class B sortase [Clostridia bacterium]|nr:class B sortase [Clostridia bacterium]NCC45369.1 class B sortase [Clostridia bacterium]